MDIFLYTLAVIGILAAICVLSFFFGAGFTYGCYWMENAINRFKWWKYERETNKRIKQMTPEEKERYEARKKRLSSVSEALQKFRNGF